MKLKIKILSFFIFISSICSGQILVEKENAMRSNNGTFSNQKIDNVFKNNKDFFFSSLVDERYDKATYSMRRNYVLRDANGIEHFLKKNEYPIDIAQNQFYSFIENVETHEKEYLVYNLNNQELDKYSSLKLSLSSSAFILKNGDVIVTEGGHSGNDWIGLYSKDLKKIHEFKPFNEESNISFDTNENYIAYVAQIGTNSKIRVALYGAFANKGFIGSQEIDIDPNLVLSSVKVAEDRVIILFSSTKSGHSQLLILDKNFTETNKISLTERASYNKIITQGGNFYINTSTKIHSFAIASGQKNWVIQKDSPKTTKTTKGYKFTGSDLFVLDDTNLLLLEATYEDGVNEIKDVTLKVIDSKSNKTIQEIKTNQSFRGDLKLKQFNKDLIIHANDKFLLYEKQ